MKRRLVCGFLALAATFAVGFVAGQKQARPAPGPGPVDFEPYSGPVHVRRYTGDGLHSEQLYDLRPFRVVVRGEVRQVTPERERTGDRFILSFPDAGVQVYAEPVE